MASMSQIYTVYRYHFLENSQKILLGDNKLNVQHPTFTFHSFIIWVTTYYTNLNDPGLDKPWAIPSREGKADEYCTAILQLPVLYQAIKLHLVLRPLPLLV